MRPRIRGFAQGVLEVSRKATSTVPFRIEPQLDPKPWGGRNLARYRLPLPPNVPVGEAVITSSEARVLDGPGQGTTLGDLVTVDPLGLAGRRGLEATANRPVFPLLVKLIDAGENLSIQVHPDDHAARVTNRLGKTEAWHVLSAEPGAVLYLGLRPDISIAELVARCQSGEATAGCLRQIPAVPGTTILVPAGTVHAIGAGVLLYEVQQPSDLTYRLDDWGRVDAEGRPRELHVDLGLRVIDAQSRPEVIPPLSLSRQGGRWLLAACRYFALEQLLLGTREEERSAFAVPESPQVVTCLEGAVKVLAQREAIPLAMGESVVIPAACTSVRVRATVPSVLLRAWVPDLMQEIVEPAREMDISDAAIAALTGGLVDLNSAARTSA